MTLVSAQALLEHGTLDLSHYDEDPRFQFDLESDYRVRHRADGHFYYNLGPPIALVPVVWVARSFGLDMVEPEDERGTQNVVSALLCGLAFGLTFVVARSLVPGVAALLIASISILGSPLISTSATALWSQTVALPLMLVTLVATIRCDPEAGLGGHFTLRRLLVIPPLLIAAFFCRPTAGFLALGVLAWFACRLRTILWSHPAESESTSSSFGFGGKLLFWCRAHRPLVAAGVFATAFLAVVALAMLRPSFPGYYQPSRLIPRISPLFGLYGVLLSPSRGLLIFCPFLLVVLAGLALAGRQLDRRPLLVLAAVWSASHLAALSVRSVWWGGHSFGPRLAAEVVLAAVIPAAVVWKSLTARAGTTPRRQRKARAFTTAYLVAGGIAIVVHTGQGLFNPSVQQWNYLPNIDTHQELLLLWRYPQFLATSDQIEARNTELQRQHLEMYAWGDRIQADGSTAVFVGWYRPVGERRWSRGHTASLEVLLPEELQCEQYRLTLHASGLDTQRVTLRINGTVAGTLTLSHPPASHDLQLPSSQLRFREINTLEFDIPDAHRPDNGDPRVLGVKYNWSCIRPIPP